jgi:hypothetical protein
LYCSIIRVSCCEGREQLCRRVCWAKLIVITLANQEVMLVDVCCSFTLQRTHVCFHFLLVYH